MDTVEALVGLGLPCRKILQEMVFSVVFFSVLQENPTTPFIFSCSICEILQNGDTLFRQIFSIFEKKMLSEIVQEVILQPDVKKKRENTSAIWYQVQIEVFQYITKH